jgi:transcriptional regulator with XRE-family HTH domain
MTGEALASKIGTDKGTISRIENGKAGLDIERLQDIAAALGIDPASLLLPPRARRDARLAPEPL